MTPEDLLKEAADLDREATPGPWEDNITSIDQHFEAQWSGSNPATIVGLEECGSPYQPWQRLVLEERDRKFITRARTLLPKLAGALRESVSEEMKERALAESFRDRMDAAEARALAAEQRATDAEAKVDALEGALSLTLRAFYTAEHGSGDLLGNITVENYRKAKEALSTHGTTGEVGPLTSAEINALPERLRRYIHDLETNCDPAGMVMENAMAKDAIATLTGEVGRLQEELNALRWATENLCDSVLDDCSADHHEDDCPGDCEEHTIGHLVNEAWDLSRPSKDDDRKAAALERYRKLQKARAALSASGGGEDNG